MSESFTQNLLLANPDPLNAATNNLWGVTENDGRTLVDSAVAGIATIAVTGGTLSLTSLQGAADQARNQRFVFTGALLSDQIVLWPNGINRFFSVENNTTGDFTLTLGVDDGSGSIAGLNNVIYQGEEFLYYSDGTNLLRQEKQSVILKEYGDINYTVTTANRACLLSFDIASAKTVTLPSFSQNWYVDIQNLGSAVLTINPSGGTIDGATQLQLRQYQSVRLVCDGTNYVTERGMISPGPQVNLASAATTDLGTAGSNVIYVRGSTSITSFGSTADVNNPIYYLRFAGALTLINSASLILPGEVSLTTGAGDTALFLYLGAGNWVCLSYQPAAQSPTYPVNSLSGQLLNVQTFATAGTETYTPTPGTNTVEVLAVAGGGSGASVEASASGQISLGSGGGAGSPGRGRYTNGNGAMAVATVSGGTITSIIMQAAGSGYTTAPTVSFSGGGGSGATATAILTGGRVTGCTITSGGSGFTISPTVVFTAAQAQTVTVGAGGAAPAAGLNNGNAGTASLFGTLLTTTGGNGGNSLGSAAPPIQTRGAAPSTAGVGGNLFNATGAGGNIAIGTDVGNNQGGMGGASILGGGGLYGQGSGGGNGQAAGSPGAGGGGAVSANGGAAFQGGAGATGIVIVWEYT